MNENMDVLDGGEVHYSAYHMHRVETEEIWWFLKAYNYDLIQLTLTIQTENNNKSLIITWQS